MTTELKLGGATRTIPTARKWKGRGNDYNDKYSAQRLLTDAELEALNALREQDASLMATQKHTTMLRMNGEAWIAAGKPFIWQVVQETTDGVICCVDTAYGTIAMLKKKRGKTVLLSIGKESITCSEHPEYMMVDAEYFDSPSWLCVFVGV